MGILKLRATRIVGLTLVGISLVLAVTLFIYGRANSAHLPNIVLITIDTVRADHLSTYGHDNRTTPTISKLAANGVIFKQAFSQAPWTLPSMASLHTSLYPSEHNAISATTKLTDEVETLAESLSNLGYYTIGLASHHFVGTRFGMDQGFDVFDESQILGHNGVTSGALTNLATKYLNNREQKPFFLWVHYFDPHVTYVRHPEYKFASGYEGQFSDEIDVEALDQALINRQLTHEDVDYIRAVYDEELAYTDSWIRTLLDRIAKVSAMKNTLTVLTSDHGEYFMERGRFLHGKDVYNELVHVPLIISGAIDTNLHGRTVDQPVEILSIPRTILEIVSDEAHIFRGENLLSLAESDPGNRFIFTEGLFAWADSFRKKAVIYKDWKLIYNFDDNSYELYNLSSDWSEQLDRWDEENDEVAAIKRLLKQSLDQYPNTEGLSAPEIQLNEKTVEHLRSLGYL
jgi:arylsulfatase A-like enzyme